MRRYASCVAVTLFAVGGFAAYAQDNCAGGLVYDDGSFENGLTYHSLLFRANFAQLIEPTPGRHRLDQVCVCWFRTGSDPAIALDLKVWAADGPGGSPGTLLATIPNRSAAAVPTSPGRQFYAFEFFADVFIDGPVYVGPSWFPGDDEDFFVCMDESGATPRQRAFGGTAILSDEPPGSELGFVGAVPQFRAFGIRALTTKVEDPEPPADPEPPEGPWLTAPTLPGYQIKALITAGAITRQGTLVDDCIVNTLCVAGAIASQPEIFVRVVGPKPNGYLWPTIIKFNTSQVEIWIERLSDAERQYYKLTASTPDGGVLPGLFDNEGFLPP